MQDDLKDDELKFWMTYPNTFIVAVSDQCEEDILGFVACKQISSTTTELMRLNVMEGVRRLGIGKLLVQEVFRHTKQMGCSKVELETSNLQHAALKLYKKLGFKIIIGTPRLPAYLRYFAWVGGVKECQHMYEINN